MIEKFQNLRPLKVCLITNTPFIGGVGTYTSHLYEEFKLQDIEVKLVCTDPLIEDPNVTILNKWNLFPLNHFLNYFVNPARTPKGYGIYHITSQSIGVFARSNNPSVVTVHDLSILIDRQIMQPAPFFMSPGIKNIYNNSLLNNIYYYFAKKSFEASKLADRIICVSSFTKRELMRCLGISSYKISVIYNGLDHSLFKQRDKEKARAFLNLPKDYTLLLNVGDEGPRKNVITVIQALGLLINKKKIRKILLLRIGEKRKVTQGLIKRFEVRDKVVYYEKVSKEILPYFYNAADLLLFPSLYEGFGLPIIEAMASACPIIASNQSAIPEIVKDAGVLIPPKDVKVLSDTIPRIMENNELRRDLTEKGLRRARDFSWKKCAHETFKEYQQLI